MILYVFPCWNTPTPSSLPHLSVNHHLCLVANREWLKECYNVDIYLEERNRVICKGRKRSRKQRETLSADEYVISLNTHQRTVTSRNLYSLCWQRWTWYCGVLVQRDFCYFTKVMKQKGNRWNRLDIPLHKIQVSIVFVKRNYLTGASLHRCKDKYTAESVKINGLDEEYLRTYS
jgi:hypothetical protein